MHETTVTTGEKGLLYYLLKIIERLRFVKRCPQWRVIATVVILEDRLSFDSCVINVHVSFV